MASSCDGLRSLVVGRYAPSVDCDDGAGNKMLYLFAPESRVCWPRQDDCRHERPVAADFLLISLGRDHRLDTNTLALIAARNEPDFNRKAYEMQERTRTLAWDYYIDGDVVLGEVNFIQTPYGEIGPPRDLLAPHPGTLGPIRRIKRRFQVTFGLGFVAFLFAAQAINFRAARRSSETAPVTKEFEE